MRKWKRTLAVAAVVVGLCLAVVVTRAVWEGRAALSRGDEAADAGDTTEAIASWRRAARWYVPGAPHVGDAYDRLEELARRAEAEGDHDTALAAWRAIRTSVNATRSFYTPHAGRRAEANEHLARLMAEVEGSVVAPGQSEDERRQWHLDLLSRDEAPSVGWSLVALLGFALWVGGGWWFAFRGVSAEDRLVARQAATAGVMIAVGLVVWMLGLYNA